MTTTSITTKDFPLAYGQRFYVQRLEAAPQLALPTQRLYRLSKDFDPDAFIKAMQHMVACHPALRLQLVKTNNGWKQRFPDHEAKISQVTVRGITRLYRSIYAEMLIAEEAKKAMDLRHESPVKTKIVRVNGEYLLSLCADHIAVDLIAFDLFEKELLNTYVQILNGSPMSRLPDETFYKYLSNEFVEQRIEQDNLLFWKHHLSGAPIGMDPTFKSSIVPANAFNCQIIGQHLTDLLHFCRKHKVSLLNVIIAIKLLLLADVGKLNDIVLSIPISNRAMAEEGTIIANLVMPVFIRFTVIPGETIAQLLLRIRDQILNAMVHRQYDYPTLSQFIRTEAKRQGVHFNLSKECNLIIDNNPIAFPNRLFEERLDNKPKLSYKIHKTTFSVMTRQSKSAIYVDIKWDAITWPISSIDMEAKFLIILQQLMKCDGKTG